MNDDIIKITPDKNKAKSILKMVEVREKRIQETKSDQFSSLLVEDFYEIIKELATAVINLNGYKTLSHKILFEKLIEDKIFSQNEIEIIEDLRRKRNKIVYDGFFVKEHYLIDREKIINSISDRLKKIVREKILNL